MLIFANGVPIAAWVGYPAYSTAGTPAPQEAVVSVNADDWTAKADLLAWAGLSQDVPASRYVCDTTWWAVMSPEGATICHSWIKDAYGIERLAEPGMTAILGNGDLNVIHGPLRIPVGEGFASAEPIGGLARRTLQPGYTRVATLPLNVAGQPGSYLVTVADGQYFDATEARAQVPMDPGSAFEIRVGDESILKAGPALGIALPGWGGDNADRFDSGTQTASLIAADCLINALIRISNGDANGEYSV